MIIVDKALEQRHAEGNPIRVAMVGAGFMARGIALQILNYVPGMDLVAIANRHLDKAVKAYQGAGVKTIRPVETVAQLEETIEQGQYSVTEDPLLLAQAGKIDVLLEVTGSLEFGAVAILEAFKHGKHVVTMNAELDGTVGPILKVYADKAGVVYSVSDGDQPGVILNLYRFVKSIGVRPVLCGNIKGLHDPYRTPATQEGFARKWGQNPSMVTSFADGSKISFEQAIVANATGMRVAKRGMYGPTVPSGTSIDDAVNWYPLEDLFEGSGIVDYVVGAVPTPAVFVLGTHDHPTQKHYLNYYKLGTGPLYCFYRPYHLCHFEIHNSIARAILFKDATITPLGEQRVDVITVAKMDLKAGKILDGIGHYMTYGICENSKVVNDENLLPLGLAEGCRLKRDVLKDQVFTYDDVEVPAGRLIDKLRVEQNTHFSKNALLAKE